MGLAPIIGNKSKKKATSEEQFPNGIDLYYGIQWWDRGNVLHPVINSSTGLGQGPSPFFDPRKPTVIYCHGWQPGGVSSTGLERLTSHDGVHLADLWIDQGWNVGSFFWTQFADEPDVQVAEAKIWETCLDSELCWPNHQMSWKGQDAKSHPWKGEQPKSASQLFYDSIVACLSEAQPDSGFQLRIVGHSLGGSMAIATGYKLALAARQGKIPMLLKPDRIAMLDPFWSTSNEAAVISRMYEVSNTHNITLEVSRASSFSAPARYGDALKNYYGDVFFAVFSWINPSYCDPVSIEALSGPAAALKHGAAVASYFLGMDPANPNGDSGPSARTTKAKLQEVRDQGLYWKQVKGMSTEIILDDEYEKLSWRSSEPIAGSSPEQWFAGFILLNVSTWGLTACFSCCCCYHLTTKLQDRSRRFRNMDEGAHSHVTLETVLAASFHEPLEERA